MAPVALPAGGSIEAKTTTMQVRRKYQFNSLFAGDDCVLKTGPMPYAPSLKSIHHGTPLNILRKWNGSDGQIWLQVQIASSEIFDKAGEPRRGWINA